MLQACHHLVVLLSLFGLSIAFGCFFVLRVWQVYYEVGWKKDFIEKNTPVMPISGWMGDNLLKKSDNMGWWKGQDSAILPPHLDGPGASY